jgi:hypothetical protein
MKLFSGVVARMPGTITNGSLTSGTLTAGEQNLWNIIKLCETTHSTDFGVFFANMCKQTSTAAPTMPAHHIQVHKSPYDISISGPLFNLTYESAKVW